MKEILKWRLKEQPTSESLQSLVTTGLLTKEEARVILFSKESEEERDKKGLEAEIKFLRELVERLSENKSQIVETIKYIERPYYGYHWYQPYRYYCSSGATGTSGTASASYQCTAGNSDFTNIKTF